jgi:hypothetical protein
VPRDANGMVSIGSGSSSGRTRPQLAPTRALFDTRLYTPAYDEMSVRSTAARMHQASQASLPTVNLAMFEHMARCMTGSPYMPCLNQSVLSSGKPVQNVVRVPYKVFTDFLRGPSSREPPCISGTACKGMEMQIPEPFILVSFYPVKRAQMCLAELINAKDPGFISDLPEQPLRDIAGNINCKPCFCILCLLFHCSTRVYGDLADQRGPLLDDGSPPIGMDVEQEGEFRTQDCIPPTYQNPNGMTFHLFRYHVDYFSMGDPPMREVDREPVPRLHLEAPPCSTLCRDARF